MTELELEPETYLATTQNLVVGQVEDVHDELRHCVPADPEEDRLSILNEEQPMALESF